MWREYENGAEIPEQSWSTLRATDRCTHAMLPSRRDKHIDIPCHGTGRPIQARNVRDTAIIAEMPSTGPIFVK
jgi:hypothetical protein